MIRFILEKLDNILQISDSIKNNKLDKFIDLLDSTILNTTSIIKLCDEEKYRKHKENIDKLEAQKRQKEYSKEEYDFFNNIRSNWKYTKTNTNNNSNNN